jgi:hypothetical protein
VVPAADEAAKYDPIDGRIYFLHAYDALLTRPEDPPFELLEAARGYNPRLRETRILLLEAYGKSARPTEALAEADTLAALLPEQRALFVELIVELILRGEAMDRTADALSRSALRGRVMVRLANRGADPAMLEKLTEPMRGMARDESERQWIGQFVNVVARRRDIDSARRIWASLHDVDESSVGKKVLDPEFASLSGTPPFGWNIGRSAVGIAEIRKGALNVYYYGRREGALASQLLLLEPGRHALLIAVSSADAKEPTGLSWQVSCANRGELLLHATLAQLMASPRKPIGFVIPQEGCQAQYLQLIGVPSDVVRRQSATIESVRIERTGA